MFILFMMRVYFIYSIFLVWRSTNTNCEYFMKGKSSFRIKLLFCDSILKLYVSECVHADVRISRSFYLESEGFSKTILFAFWIPFFLLLLSFIWILVQFFFLIFQFGRINKSRHKTPTLSRSSVIIKIVCFGKGNPNGCDGCFKLEYFSECFLFARLVYRVKGRPAKGIRFIIA